MDRFIILIAIMLSMVSNAYSQAQWNPEPGCVEVRTAEQLIVAMEIVNEGCTIDLVLGDTLDLSPYKALDFRKPGIKLRTRFDPYREPDHQQGGAVILWDTTYADSDLEAFPFVITKDNTIFEGITFIGPECGRDSWRDIIGVAGAIKFQNVRKPQVFESEFLCFPKWALQFDGYQHGQVRFNIFDGIQDDGYGYAIWLGPQTINYLDPSTIPTASQAEQWAINIVANRGYNIGKLVDGSYRFTAKVRDNMCERCFRGMFDIHDSQNLGAGWWWSFIRNKHFDNRSSIIEIRNPPVYYGELLDNSSPQGCGGFAFLNQDARDSVVFVGNFGSFDNKQATLCE